MDAEAFHVPVVDRDADVIVEPGKRQQALREMGEEVQNPPILLNVRLRVWFEGVNHVREFDGITDEEDGEIVTNNVEIPLPAISTNFNSIFFFTKIIKIIVDLQILCPNFDEIDEQQYLSGVELDGESTRISDGLGAAALVDDGGESDDERRLDARCSEEVRTRQVRDVVRHLEEALGGGAARVDYTLRDPLAREVGELLDQVVVLEQHRTCESFTITTQTFFRSRSIGEDDEKISTATIQFSNTDIPPKKEKKIAMKGAF